MVAWILGVLAGALAGVLSGFGIGGGTLLLLYLTHLTGMTQPMAQGVNLLFFLPAAALALPGHFKGGYVATSTAVPAILAGLVGAGLAAWVATGLEVALLRRWFGGFLLVIGLRELFRKSP